MTKLFDTICFWLYALAERVDNWWYGDKGRPAGKTEKPCQVPDMNAESELPGELTI